MAEKITKEAKAALKFIKKAYEEGNEQIIDKVEALAGIPVKLSGKLLEVYDKIGDTPLETPELLLDKDDFEDSGDFLTELAKRIEKSFGVKESEFPADEFISFLMYSHAKVNNFTYSDGTSKTTPLTENSSFMTLSVVNEVKKTITDATDATQKTLNGFDEDIDDSDELTDTLKEIEKGFQDKLLKLAYKSTGVKAKGLTEWEKKLLKNTLISSATDSIQRSASWRSL